MGRVYREIRRATVDRIEKRGSVSDGGGFLAGSRLRSVDQPIEATWLGRVAYRDGWARQKTLVEQRADRRIPDQLVLLEHDAVLTLGRQADERHVLARPSELLRRGVEPGLMSTSIAEELGRTAEPPTTAAVERAGAIFAAAFARALGAPLARLAPVSVS